MKSLIVYCLIFAIAPAAAFANAGNLRSMPSTELAAELPAQNEERAHPVATPGTEAVPDLSLNRCSILLCVFAAPNGTGPLVGVSPLSNNALIRFIQGDWYQMNYSLDLGFDRSVPILYTMPKCDTQPHIMVGTIIGPADLINPNAIRLTSPAPAVYDGTDIWIPNGPAAVLTIKSFKLEGVCNLGSWAPNPVAAAPAISVAAPPLPLPWKVR